MLYSYLLLIYQKDAKQECENLRDEVKTLKDFLETAR